MSSTPSLLTRLWQRLFPRSSSAASPEQPVRLRRANAPQPLPAREPRRVGIEPLEGRIAPAALFGPLDLHYTDLNGDLVDIHFSKPLFDLHASTLNTDLSSVFVFANGDAYSGTTTMQQLTKINLNAAHFSAKGVSLSVTVLTQGSGDGLVNVGTIQATGLPLGTVKVQGDLGSITCGVATAPVGLQALDVVSLGHLTDTQGSTTPSYASSIVGTLGSFHAKLVEGAYLQVKNGSAGVFGNIGSLVIDTTLSARGTSATAVNDGRIDVAGSIGSLILGKLNTSSVNALVGGLASESGAIAVAGHIGTLKVTGNLAGKSGLHSGSITAGTYLGSVDVLGQIVGGSRALGTDGLPTGTATASGFIQASGKIFSAALGTGTGAALTGGEGAGSGLLSSGAGIGKVLIRGDLQGLGPRTGGVFASGAIGNVTVSGSLLGGSSTTVVTSNQQASGCIESDGALGNVSIAGNLVGGTQPNSGLIYAGTSIGSVTVNGHLAGGAGAFSGSIQAGGTIFSAALGSGTGAALTGGEGASSGLLSSGAGIGKVIIRGDLQGLGPRTGGVFATGAIGNATVSGSLLGGSPTTPVTGSQEASGCIESDGALGNVSIAGNLAGGTQPNSGLVYAGTSIGSVTVGGHLAGGAGAFSGSIVNGALNAGTLFSVVVHDGLAGGAGAGSGAISSGGRIASAKILLKPETTAAASMVGGAGFGSGTIYAEGTLGFVQTGNILGGMGESSGSITGHGTLTNLTLGDVTGGSGAYSGAIISAGRASDQQATSAFLAKLTAGTIHGGTGAFSGAIAADGSIGQATLAGLLGGTGESAGAVAAGVGTFGVGNIASLIVTDLGRQTTTAAGGQIEVHGRLGVLKTTQIYQAEIHAGSIGSLSAQSLTGSTIDALGHPSAVGPVDLAIGSVTVAGPVSGTNIRAGYDFDGEGVNGHAQIGTVTVNGDWTASNLVAGVAAANSNGFGAAGDSALPGSSAKLFSKIANVVIKGTVTSGTNEEIFAFTAEQIGALSVHGVVKSFHAAVAGESFPLASGVVAREVTIPA